MNRKLFETIIEPKLSARLLGRQAHIEACQVLANARIAAIKGNKTEEVEDAIFHLRRCEKYHFNAVALGLSRFLHTYYRTEFPDESKAKVYKSIREKYKRLADIEELVDISLLEITSKVNSKKHPGSYKADLIDICASFDQYLELESAPISVKIYTLKVVLAYLENDYDRVIDLCKEVIDWLESKGFAWFAIFYYYLVPALIISKRFDEGRKYIKKAMSNVNRKSTNWDTFAFARFLLEMHEGNYQEAYFLFKKVERKTIKRKYLKERWLIAKGYLSFLRYNEIIKTPGNFKLSKFLNEVPNSTKDKAGYNVDVLMISILHRLKSDPGWMIDRQEAIKKYIQRHLNGRSKIILKMLLSGIKNNFDAQSMTDNNIENLNRLKEEQQETTEILAFEIIPYERLWEIVIKNL